MGVSSHPTCLPYRCNLLLPAAATAADAASTIVPETSTPLSRRVRRARAAHAAPTGKGAEGRRVDAPARGCLFHPGLSVDKLVPEVLSAGGKQGEETQSAPDTARYSCSGDAILLERWTVARGSTSSKNVENGVSLQACLPVRDPRESAPYRRGGGQPLNPFSKRCSDCCE